MTKRTKRSTSKTLTVSSKPQVKAVVPTQTQTYSGTANKLNTRWIQPRILNMAANPYRFLSAWERNKINAYALDLYRSSPLINSAINRKNEWSCATHWQPIFRGKDKEWGKLALDYLNNELYATCNIAGPNYTWNRTLLTIANQLDIAGDCLIVFVPNETGMRLAVYPSGMVGQRDSKTVMEQGRYKGNEIDNGVVYARSGYPVAFNILQDTKDEDFLYSIKEANLLFEPNELCRRGISVLASPLLSLLDMQDIHGNINRTVKIDSRLPVAINTETGTGGDYTDGPGDTTDTTTGTAAEINSRPNVIEMDDYVFFKANVGEKFEVPQSNRPNSQAVDWLRHVSEECCTALGWPMGLIHQSQLAGSQAGRTIEAQVQQTIAVRQETLKRIAKIYTTSAITRAMESGRLPKVTTSDWRAWEWAMPPEFVMDSYYSDQTDLQGLNAGTKTLQQVTSRNGGNWEETRAQRQYEIADACKRAKELQKEFTDLSFERALDLVGTGGKVNATPIQEQKITREDT